MPPDLAAQEIFRDSYFPVCSPKLLAKGTTDGMQLKKLKEATKIVFWQKYKPVVGNAET
jgi:hypothetical protein